MPEKGSVVLATAGRDAGGLYVVLERTENAAAEPPKTEEPAPCAGNSPAAGTAAIRGG